MAGVFIGVGAVVGKWPILDVATVIRKIGKALLIVLALALLILFASLRLKDRMPQPMDDYFHNESPTLRLKLDAVGSTHLFSYAGNFIATIWVCISILVQRYRLKKTAVSNTD